MRRSRFTLLRFIITLSFLCNIGMFVYLFCETPMDFQVAIHGVPRDQVKKHTKVKYRSREPHWEEEFEFRIRGGFQVLLDS